MQWIDYLSVVLLVLCGGLAVSYAYLNYKAKMLLRSIHQTNRVAQENFERALDAKARYERMEDIITSYAREHGIEP